MVLGAEIGSKLERELVNLRMVNIGDNIAAGACRPQDGKSTAQADISRARTNRSLRYHQLSVKQS